MLKLYHHPMSAHSRFVRLILAEYGQEVEPIEEQAWERRDEFLALNPAATLPVLADRTVTLAGYYPIAEFLEETHGKLKPDQSLLPKDVLLRAEARRLVDWSLVKLDGEVTKYLALERVFKRLMPTDLGGGAPDSSALRAGRANLKYHIQYLGWLADTRNWLAGERRSYADFAAAAALSVLDYLGEVDWNDDPALKDWYARIKSRPSFRDLLHDKVKGIPPSGHYSNLDF